MTLQLTDQDLVHLSEVIVSIFSGWGVDADLQLRLLGFAAGTPVAELHRLRTGEAFPADGDRLERAEQLLAIHDCLRTAYPRSAVMAAHWLRQPHRRTDNRAPLAVMLEDGLPGLKRVRGLLDCTQNWI
jgi:hypothetical protein